MLSLMSVSFLSISSMLWLLSLRLSYNLLSAHPLIEGAALKAERMVTLDVFPRNLTWLLMQRCLTIKYFNYNLNAAFSACPFWLHSLQSKISVFSISRVLQLLLTKLARNGRSMQQWVQPVLSSGPEWTVQSTWFSICSSFLFRG